MFREKEKQEKKRVVYRTQKKGWGNYCKTIKQFEKQKSQKKFAKFTIIAIICCYKNNIKKDRKYLIYPTRRVDSTTLAKASRWALKFVTCFPRTVRRLLYKRARRAEVVAKINKKKECHTRFYTRFNKSSKEHYRKRERRLTTTLIY